MARLDRLVDLLALDSLPRTGWILVGVPQPESVAGHSLGAALLALTLGPEVEPPLDVDRAAALCAVHDTPEAWLGDLPRPGASRLPDGAKHAAEQRIADDFLAPLSAALRDRVREYESRESREARFARLCDGLQLGLRLVGYRRAGQRGLDAFRATLERLDASEFAPCESFRRELLEALDALDRDA